MQEFLDFFAGLRYSAPARELATLVFYMIVGGGLGYYIRELYRRFGRAASNRDKFSMIFPTVILATTLVIFVIKSSLVLSLGLVGALSIVRFRAAIKEPEEIVYLFFCVAVGLALGAEYFPIAIGGVMIFSVFVVLVYRIHQHSSEHNLLLIVRGEQKAMFDGDLAKITAAIGDIMGPLVMQRLDIEEGQVQFRATIQPAIQSGSQRDIGASVAMLESQLPGCQVSYVNLENPL